MQKTQYFSRTCRTNATKMDQSVSIFFLQHTTPLAPTYFIVWRVQLSYSNRQLTSHRWPQRPWRRETRTLVNVEYENKRSSVGHGICQCIVIGDLGRALVLQWSLLDVCRFWSLTMHDKMLHCCLLAWICRERIRLSNQYQCSKTINKKGFTNICRSFSKRL